MSDERPERWMVDYEHGEGEPQHAVLSWLDDEAKELPETDPAAYRREDEVAAKEEAWHKAREILVANGGPR